MGEALRKLKPINKYSEVLLEHPRRSESERFEFASAALCMYMYVLYIIMNMIIVGDNL